LFASQWAINDREAMSEDTKPRGANTSPTMSVDVNGTRFAYREFGPRTGVPVVFLHHFTAV
jgi:hypothetical protein